MKQRRTLMAAGLATVLLTTAAACGGDSDESSVGTAAAEDTGGDSATAPEATEAPATTAAAAPEATDAPATTASAATTAPAADRPDTSKGDIPDGGVEVTIEGDVTALDGVTAGIANLAPVPGAERWSRPLESCLTGNGADVDFQDVGGDPTKLPAILDAWLAGGRQAAFNIDMSGQESTLGAFGEAGVPFITWGAGNPEGVVSLDANQEEDGRIIARFVAEQLGGAGDVLLVNANNPALQSREAGISEVLAEYPDITLTVTGDALGFTVEAAQASTEAALQSNPDIAAVIGGFGSLGIGAANAVEAAGSSAIVVSMNGDPEEYAAIRAGGPFKATVADGHEFGGEAACQIAASMLAGNSAPGEPGVPIFATSVLVTADNVPAEGEIESTPRKFYQLP
jgi:ribose transport system substrate-binding protein